MEEKVEKGNTKGPTSLGWETRFEVSQIASASCQPGVQVSSRHERFPAEYLKISYRRHLP